MRLGGELRRKKSWLSSTEIESKKKFPAVEHAVARAPFPFCSICTSGAEGDSGTICTHSTAFAIRRRAQSQRDHRERQSGASWSTLKSSWLPTAMS